MTKSNAENSRSAREFIGIMKKINNSTKTNAKISRIISKICVPVIGTENNHGEIDVENIIVIVDNYPIEKEYPTVDWVALKRLLDDKKLVEIVD
jgi:hypothetical protein